MRVLFVGGFLGSGKTTLIKKLIHGIISGGDTVAIIENEIGEVGIDDAVLGEADVRVTPIFGGCVCCQVTGNLIDATKKIEQEVNPGWLIIELTGLAFMSGMIEIFERYGKTDTSALGVVDISRWDVMKRAMGHLFEHQLEGADLVLLNKSDVRPPDLEVFDEIRRMSGAENIEAVCARDMADSELWSLVLQNIGSGVAQYE